MLSYQDFLNEQVEPYSDIKEYINSELDNIFECDSFSYLLKADEKNIDEKVEKCFKILNKNFGKNKVQEFVKLIIKENLTTDYCDMPNGLLDLIFYKYDNKFPLGSNPFNEDDSCFIRYIYGWHNKKYGKLAIMQEYSTLEQYSKHMINEHKNFYIEEDLGKEDKDIAICGPLILDPNSGMKNGIEITSIGSIYNDRKNYTCPNKVHFNKATESGYVSLIEILDHNNKSLVKPGDWIHLFEQAIDKFPEDAKLIDWIEILKEYVPNSTNFVQSKLSISKFNL